MLSEQWQGSLVGSWEFNPRLQTSSFKLMHSNPLARSECFSPISVLCINLLLTEVAMCSAARCLVVAHSLIFAAWVVKLEVKQWHAALKCLCYRPLNGLANAGTHTHISFLLHVTHMHKPLQSMWMDSIQVVSVPAFMGTNKTKTHVLPFLGRGSYFHTFFVRQDF